MTATVTVRYWAGAREAAGVDEESCQGATVAQALADAKSRRESPYFERVLGVCSFLVDGQRIGMDSPTVLEDGTVIEVLPPFAGG